MEMTVKLQVFEGPLDLLLYLLEKNKVNIYDIPIVEITDQYMEYIDEMRQRDLEVMSEFLVMAATLLSIKAKMLLPKKKNEDEEEVDPREELVQQLLEYKMYKYMAYELKDRQIDAEKSMYKKPTIPEEVKSYEEPVNLDELVKGITLQKLNKIFKDVMKKQVDKVDPIRSKFGKIEKEEFSLEEKMLYVENYALNRSKFSFKNLLEEQSSKTEIIVTFLAILELMKSGKIYISQEEIFGDICIESKIYTKEKKNFEVNIINPDTKKYDRDKYEVDINSSDVNNISTEISKNITTEITNDDVLEDTKTFE
ncbi:condensin subunit ScpA [Lachnobacterium bovis DSM 14045]|jgi:segregation and condensation protein A|uniref:Segregation and condensation protein A n=1 Tax=Lachnobacterium bovis DSM 14045 TaxID=1122142 RepID=A0A1H3FSZ9_9FIRM|nr:segregation/condensation protein A [Lachnobacterium bovis]SDX93274.1 condensin subunit ScpA [Lachnobacterium bovis DSM 14045]